MNVSIFIGRRLSFNRGDDPQGNARMGQSPGVPIAIGGIVLALIIMMVSVAVVMGFKKEIRRKVAGFTSELTVYPVDRSLSDIHTLNPDSAFREAVAMAIPGATIDPVIELPGIVKTDADFRGILLKALEPDAAGFRFIRSNLLEGAMPVDSAADAISDPTSTPPQPKIALSSTIASRLGLAPGDKVDMHFIHNGTLRTRRVIVSGIYDTHFGEYDSRYVYTSPSTARSIARIPLDEATSVEINTPRGADNVEAEASMLYSTLLQESVESHQYYAIDNIARSGMAYFAWLDLLDTNVIVILILMSLVSGFTLISSMFILILERVRTIGILKSLGATNSEIRGIFIYMAERLVARGLIIGNIIGVTILLIQAHFHIIPLDPDAYFLNFVPVDINIPAILILNAAVIAISAIILILPSHIIATLSPSESMRYE